MFTGIVAGIGRIRGRRNVGVGIALDIEAGFDITDPEEGESIAVSGVCLTAYNIRGRLFTADVSPETLSRTKLGHFAIGDSVNLERALRMSDRLGGHLVSGHVDCLATVASISDVGEYTIFKCTLTRAHSRYVIEKGSIAIDGVSLTVNSCSESDFSVSIIPHTMSVTTLGNLKIGSKVNIEVDIIGKYVEKLLAPREKTGKTGGADRKNGGRSEGINAGFLAQHGFF